MLYSPLIDNLIEALQCLPGVGPKSAQRMVFYLLERNRKGGFAIAQAMQAALEKINHCQHCRNLSEQPLCHLCANPKRDPSLLCIIETPADVIAVEQTGCYKGLYFVLGGHLSPIDGIGPQDLSIDMIVARLKQKTVQELILATNPTVEGEATAHYIAELAKIHNVKTSRIAYGVPFGGELEHIDSGTLARALLSRDDYTF